LCLFSQPDNLPSFVSFASFHAIFIHAGAIIDVSLRPFGYSDYSPDPLDQPRSAVPGCWRCIKGDTLASSCDPITDHSKQPTSQHHRSVCTPPIHSVSLLMAWFGVEIEIKLLGCFGRKLDTR